MSQLIISFILILLLILLSSFEVLLMPKSIDMLLVIGVILFFFIYSIFFWKERSIDEREKMHIMSASRISFFVGSLILLIGIVYQGLNHNIDPWLIFTLIAMIIAKNISRIYSNIKN